MLVALALPDIATLSRTNAVVKWSSVFGVPVVPFLR